MARKTQTPATRVCVGDRFPPPTATLACLLTC
jgi:hypothetical protein